MSTDNPAPNADDDVFVPDPDPAPPPVAGRSRASDERDSDRDPDRDRGRRRRRYEEDDEYDDPDERYRPRGRGRKFDEEGHEITSDDTMWAIFAHVGVFLLGLLAPLIILIIYSQKSPYVARHAKSSLNHQLSLMLYIFVWLAVAAGIGFAVYGVAGGKDGPLIGFVVGYILFLIGTIFLSIANLVFLIIATITASKGEYYRYPMTIKFVG